MKKLDWIDDGLWEYYTQELDRILCGTIKAAEHDDLLAIYSHYLNENKAIPIQLQEYINLYFKDNELNTTSKNFYKKNEYLDLVLVVCVRWRESHGENRINAIGLTANLFNTHAELIFKIYDKYKDKADQYISTMPNMHEIKNFLESSPG